MGSDQSLASVTFVSICPVRQLSSSSHSSFSFYCLVIAIRIRSSDEISWFWSSSPRSICTQWILPLNLLACRLWFS